MFKIVCVRDIKADLFHNPIFVVSTGSAVRSFGDEINKTDGNPYSQHPEDYELYQLGTFNELDGTIEATERTQLAHGGNLVITR